MREWVCERERGKDREREKDRERLCLYWSFSAGTRWSCGNCSTLFHTDTPEGYTDNKAVVKFGHFQWFVLTFANSSHMAIETHVKGSREREVLVLCTFPPVKYARKVKLKCYSSCAELTHDRYDLQYDLQACKITILHIVFGRHWHRPFPVLALRWQTHIKLTVY